MKNGSIQKVSALMRITSATPSPGAAIFPVIPTTLMKAELVPMIDSTLELNWPVYMHCRMVHTPLTITVHMTRSCIVSRSSI